ncbi:hypothetical protein AB4Y32_16175 [Paraburkholderia phymatum]|uniref:Uncharacterized protein n=1 Tax=Paraburkholderia phymatum TaxID=148447 RepID=A0ACC6U179_9BURK
MTTERERLRDEFLTRILALIEEAASHDIALSGRYMANGNSAHATSVSKPTLAELKSDMLAKIREAEKAAYAYFCECEVGPERERAHDVYSNILYSTRVG